MSSRVSHIAMRRLPKHGRIYIGYTTIGIRFNSTAVPNGKIDKSKLSGESRLPAQTETAKQFPLSIMPTTMLLRSLLTSTVSSTPSLLLPSLSILSWLSKPGRALLFNIERNPILHAILKKTFYNQFCAGETEKETRACVRQLKDLGFRGVILTYAKEIVFDHTTKTSHGFGCVSDSSKESSGVIKQDPQIEAWKVGTLQTVDLIGDGDILAIK